MSCSVGSRHGSDLVLLWRRLAATAPIQPLPWELPHATDAALKRKEKKNLLNYLLVVRIVYFLNQHIFKVQLKLTTLMT